MVALLFMGLCYCLAAGCQLLTKIYVFTGWSTDDGFQIMEKNWLYVLPDIALTRQLSGWSYSRKCALSTVAPALAVNL